MTWITFFIGWALLLIGFLAGCGWTGLRCDQVHEVETELWRRKVALNQITIERQRTKIKRLSGEPTNNDSPQSRIGV